MLIATRQGQSASVVTQSRQSAFALTALGLFVLLALAHNPDAGAKLPSPAAPAPAALLAPAIAAIAPLKTVTAATGDTLASALARSGMATAAAQGMIDALAPQWEPSDFEPGEEAGLRLEDRGLETLDLPEGIDRDGAPTRSKDGRYDVSTVSADPSPGPVRVAGAIRSSLFGAASRAGLPPAVLAEMIEAFSYDVDFQREVQPGDRFEVIYDRLADKSGKIAAGGAIAYAALDLGGRDLALYRYTPPGGIAGYYTAAGESVKKALLRTPVDGARISSGFGMRMHPILGYTAMHKGVDFAVPAGTPIMASGDGVVASAGPAGSYGNLVVLRHESGYSTAYAHMSRIAKGMKPGLRVRQGEVIGYVGMTGRATGPHLHYEVRIDNRPVNPLGVRMPAALKLAGKALAQFRRQKDAVDRQLAALRGTAVLASR